MRRSFITITGRTWQRTNEQKNREKEDEREVPVSEEEKTDRFAKGGDKKVSERIEKQEKTEGKKLEILAGIAVFTVLLAIFLIRKREK